MSRSKIPSKIPSMITDSNQACLFKRSARGFQEELMDFTLELLEEKRQNFYFIILKKNPAKSKSWELKAPRDIEPSLVGARLVPREGKMRGYLKGSGFQNGAYIFSIWKGILKGKKQRLTTSNPCSLRQLEACCSKAAPMGLPSSPVQLRGALSCRNWNPLLRVGW
jgi:hypothetical protein